MRRPVAGERQQHPSHRIARGDPRLSRDLGCPRRPILDAAAGEERDEPVRQQIQKVAQCRRSFPQRLGDEFRVVARQHSGWSGQAHQPNRHLRQTIALLADLDDVGRRIDQPRGRTKPHGIGRVLRPPCSGQHTHGRIEAKAPWLRPKLPEGRAPHGKAKGAPPPWSPCQGTVVPWTPRTGLLKGGPSSGPPCNKPN